MTSFSSRILQLGAALTVLTLILVAVGILATPASAAPGDVIGDRVFGQSGSFVTNGCGLSASALCSPSGVAVDSAGNVYVADTANNRVLEYNTPLSTDTIADRVFGQGGSFTSSTCNLGGISASSLCQPLDVAVDSSDNLYVVDWQNNRVLEYYTPLTTDTIADRVFGQLGSMATGTYTTTPTADTLTNPVSVAVDGAGNVYIADRGMHRILEYNPPNSNTTANRVFGQFGSFTTGTYNNGGTSANSLSDILGIGVDGAGSLYVADQTNARVLKYNTPISSDTTADMVFGQYGSFTTGIPNNGGVSADTLETPTDVGVDSAGNVYITDTGPERTLEFDNPVVFGTTADVVFGQGGNFNAFGNNSGGLSASSQADPWAIAFDHSCNLYVVEYGNNRVTEFDQPPHACVAAVGTPGPTSTIPPATPSPSPTPVSGGCTPSPVNPAPCTPTPCSPCLTPPGGTPTPTGAVGGVSELLVSGGGGSGASGNGLAFALGAGVAAALVLVISAWYARRHRSGAAYGDRPREG
jgi:hypothetical protein